MPKLDVSALESWLWETACVIRGPLDAPKFKDYILPLIFLKRLSDVFDDEVRYLAEEFGGRYNVSKLVEQDHKLVWFYIPAQARWSAIARKTSGLAFTEGDGRLRRFDLVTANPMWNQHFPTNTYEHDAYERFALGIPPGSSADWGWIQHMVASLKREGRMALVIDTGAVSRGSGNKGSNRERDIRRAFVEHDLIEAVIILPENLFYNTTAPAVIIVLNKKKRHPGEILLINASKLFAKGRPKNYLTAAHIQRVARVYHDWQAEESVSAIITREEAAKNDFNLSPSRYVATEGQEEVLPLEEAMVQLRQAEEERAEADRKLNEVLTQLGIGGSLE